MTDPISFTSATPRFGLPNLFVAQAQKEFTVNEALARLDGLLHPAIVAEADVPPAAPDEGQAWLVGAQPIGDWADHPGAIALWQAQNWLFVEPTPGMSVYDLAAACVARYDGIWQRAATIAEPAGGPIEDIQARTAINQLITALVGAGILPAV
ncbi:DUF2793 domain-containing protein [Aurantiacibacter marinus]|uniref:DUF2793 domain-containing protein n=1 Tax=Aurantiacibacter marinus TaxID=874156 RepID=A0A0H0XX44_9SPHN|nr:DUF2793 domain-containing protein [Aurantiacibacter marinus]KLI64850.1 hypothetical protein AAV99_04915 [Aurantiacibacter marinus]